MASRKHRFPCDFPRDWIWSETVRMLWCFILDLFYPPRSPGLMMFSGVTQWESQILVPSLAVNVGFTRAAFNLSLLQSGADWGRCLSLLTQRILPVFHAFFLFLSEPLQCVACTPPLYSLQNRLNHLLCLVISSASFNGFYANISFSVIFL